VSDVRVLPGAVEGTDVDNLALAAGELPDEVLSPWRLAWRRFRRHRMAMASAVVLVVVTVAVFAPGLLADYSPNEQTGERLVGPTADHWFGTDTISRDMLARVLHGGQISLQVGFAVAIVSGLIGTAIGAIAGFYGRWLDNALMRATDLFLAVPLLVVLILLGRLPDRYPTAETLMGESGSVRAIITILSLFFWMPMARIVRGLVLSLKEKEFVEAARALGASDRRLVLRHLVPNCAGPIVVNVTLAVAAAILTESALSFLGFGVQSATTATWGNLLNGVEGYTRTAPHLVWFPGLAILVTVLCVNYLGDGLRDALDPRQGRVRE
jgi:peptide/nickel transport system permease protein